MRPPVPESWKILHEAHSLAVRHGLIKTVAEEKTIGGLDWDPRRYCSLCKAANNSALLEYDLPTESFRPSLQAEITILCASVLCMQGVDAIGDTCHDCLTARSALWM